MLGNDTLVKDIDVCDLNGIECNENSNIIQIDASGTDISYFYRFSLMGWFDTPQDSQCQESRSKSHVSICFGTGFGLECGSQIQQLQLLDHLQRLDLSNNQLTGIIPYYLSESLAHLNLDDNMLVGSIPVPYATHPTLTTLSVSNNKLTDLPVEWEYLVYKKGEAGFPLKYVNVAGNSLEGSFPQGLAFYPLLETLDVSNNQLTGELGPKGYSDAFQSVQSLNVQNNKLQGPIPEWALYISNLSTSGNAFGAFPKEDDSTSTSGLSPGAIAGIVIGTILGIGLIFTATIIAWKKYNTRKEAFQRYDHVDLS